MLRPLRAFGLWIPRMAGPLAILLAVSLDVPPASADVVTDWNSIWLDCIRATGGPPTPIARAGAMVHAAVYDAVNSIDRTHEPYLASLPAPDGASEVAAAAAAAHDVLVSLYPGRQSILDEALARSLADVPDGPDEDAGIALGRAAAQAIL